MSRMKTFSMTDVGMKRQMNQDYIFTSEIPVGNLPNLFIVADGMGGHNAGDFASRYTVETVLNQIRASSLTDPVGLISQALEYANQEILHKASTEPEYRGMGTTFVAATIEGHHLSVANVGDSRLYIVNYKIQQVTRDHSYVQEMVRLGKMDQEDARTHPDKNVITRAVGAAAELEVDFFEFDLQPYDRILLCSDGLTNMIEDEQIRRIMCSQRDLAESVQRLIATANQNGGKDNISVIIIEPYSDEVKG